MSPLQIRVDAAIQRILDGLYTDGGHHKQWALEEALKALLTPKQLERLKDREDEANDGLWEEGIAP